LYCLKAIGSQQQGIGIGISYILRGQNQQSSGYEFDVLPSFYHSCEPIYCSIWITSPDGFDKGGYNIIMLLPGFIINSNSLLGNLHYLFICNYTGVLIDPLYGNFEQIQKFTPITPGYPQQSIRFL